MIVIVDNLAQEKVHKKDLGLFALEEKFPIENQGEQMLLDVEGYQRFNPFAEGIVSINSNLLVDIYLALEPGIEKLYQDLGYPDKTFRSSMLAAIENIQSAPLIYDPIYLVRPEYFYKFSDPALESLSPLDKQFIRMGPVNTMLIQEKLSEIATLLKQRTASAN